MLLIKGALSSLRTRAAALAATLIATLMPTFALAGEGDVQLKFTGSDMNYLYASLGFGAVAILFGLWVRQSVIAVSPGSAKMQEVGQAIREGALAYLRQQVQTMSVFVILLAIGLVFMFPATPAIAITFVAGVACSYIAGYAGMLMAVDANMRTANAALTSCKKALETAFRSGAVAGMFTVGMGLIGATVIFLIARNQAMQLLIGFGFGGSLAALFMRVGGGIFTKAADVGADLVGKVEAGIPEDDARNPATIADNVGDNVGDCAGMAADIFESYEVTLVAAIVLGAATALIFDQATWMRLILFALMARGVGIIASIFGVLSVKGSDDVDRDPLRAIRSGFYTSAVVALAATFVLAYFMMGGSGLPISTRTLVPLEQFRQDEVRAVKAIREGLAKATGKQAYQITAVEVLASPEAKKLNFAPTDEPFVNQMFQQRTETFLAPPNLAGLQKVDFTDQTLAFLNYATMKPQFTPGDQDNWSDLRTVFQPDATGKSTYVVAKIHQVLDVEAKPSQGNTPARPAQHNDATLWVGPISERVLDTEIDKAKANAAQQQAILKLEKVDTRSVELYASADGSHLALAFPPGPERPHTVRPAIQLSYFANTKDEIKKIQSSPSGPQGLPEAKTIDLAVATGATVPWFMFALTIAFGIGMAFAIEFLTDYYVSTHKKPVQEVAGVATAGPAPMIIQGFALALESSVFMVFSIVFALIMPLVFFPPSLYGGMILSFYGVALVGLGLLTTTGYVLAMDTFGPISDNAQGVFEMSGEGHGNVYGLKAVQRLDAAGNTTKALTKGFAIATAVVAAVALFHSYLEASKLQAFGLRLDTPEIFLGLLIGGAAPYLFSASTINAVGRASFQLINEVRRQFRSDPGIMTRTSKPDYARCVSIVTAAAQKELIGPAILAIALPIAVGFGFSIGKAPTIINGQPYNLTGAQALGGFLAGAILSGQLMAVLLANSGGIWDNAKKLIEDGMHGGKGTEAHKAGVVVDTVGDPFKDTAGPALNPLIKVMNLVALLLAPIYIRPFGNAVLVTVTVTAVALLAVSIWWSKRGSMSSALAEAKHEEAAALAAATDGAPPDQPKAKKKLTVDD